MLCNPFVPLRLSLILTVKVQKSDQPLFKSMPWIMKRRDLTGRRGTPGSLGDRRPIGSS